jgi:hypothetical protein
MVWFGSDVRSPGFRALQLLKRTMGEQNTLFFLNVGGGTYEDHGRTEHIILPERRWWHVREPWANRTHYSS